MKIFANQRPDKGSKTGVSDNYIEIYQSVWTDEYLTPQFEILLQFFSINSSLSMHILIMIQKNKSKK